MPAGLLHTTCCFLSSDRWFSMKMMNRPGLFELINTVIGPYWAWYNWTICGHVYGHVISPIYVHGNWKFSSQHLEFFRLVYADISIHHPYVINIYHSICDSATCHADVIIYFVKLKWNSSDTRVVNILNIHNHYIL